MISAKKLLENLQRANRSVQQRLQSHQDQQPSVTKDQLDEKWSKKYKRNIDCDNPRGFSQRAHCQGRAKNEAANPAQQAATAINMKKHHQKPKNEGVAEGSSDNNAVIYDNGYVKIDGKMYKAKRMNHESGLGIVIQTPTKMYFSPIENEYEMPSVTIHRALKMGGLNPVFNEGVAEMNVGKRKPQPDTYHIVNKDGTPTSLMCYLDKDNAIKDRDAKHKGAEVHQVGPRGKVKGVAEGYEPGDKVTWYYSNHYPKVEGTVVGIKDGKYRIKSVSPVPGQEHTDPAIYAVPKNNIMSHTKQGVAEGSETECPRCHSTDIKTYSDGEKKCHQCHKTWDEQGVAEGLNEFAPPGGDDGDDGFSEETLKIMAAHWWNSDQDPGVEKTLAAAGWEIGQDEGYDNGGVFVVQAGDINGNSYISWPAEELEGLLEDAEDDDIASNAAMIAGPGTTDLTTPKPTATPMAAPTATATPVATAAPKPTAAPTATATPVATATPKPTAAPTPRAAPTAAGSNEIKDLQNKLIAAGEKIKADGIMGPRTQAALNRYNAKTSPTTAVARPATSTPASAAPASAAPASAAPASAAPATAVQSGSGSPIRTGSGGYVVSPDYAAASDSPPQNPYNNDLMLAAIKNRESGGDPNAVSRAGAVGTMQTMPNTLRDPGFGVKPARDNSPQELERVGRDYYAAMLKNYNDPKVALAAYNWGPGNVNKWLKAGGDFSKLPGETRAYVKNIMGDYQAAQSAQATKMAGASRPPVSETRREDPNMFGGMHQDDFQAALQRLKQLAKIGPMKTVRDPHTGRTRNVPAKPNK